MATAASKRVSTASSASSTSTNGSITTTRKTDRSKFMKLLQYTTRPILTRMPPPTKEYPEGSPQLVSHSAAQKHCNIHERIVEDIYIYDLMPKVHNAQGSDGVGEMKQKQLYYFAGGSWRAPPSKEHWAFCAELAKQLPGVQVSVISMPLAPNTPAPKAFPHLLRLYRRLLRDAEAKGEAVILAGDSSGGEQVLCLTGNSVAEDSRAPAPTAVVAICPSVDLRQSNVEQLDVEKNDPVLRIASSRGHADLWRASWTAVDERINPLYIDWKPTARKGVRVHGVVGGHDILRPDAIKLRDQLAAAGVEGEWLDWDGQMHGYPLTFTYGLQEGKEAKNWIVDVIGRS